MARFQEFNKESGIDIFANKGIIFLCENFDLKTIKNTLYQIRCNIFHGEKIPGDINDDRIVKSANPILNYIVEKLIHEQGIIKTN